MNVFVNRIEADTYDAGTREKPVNIIVDHYKVEYTVVVNHRTKLKGSMNLSPEYEKISIKKIKDEVKKLIESYAKES